MIDPTKSHRRVVQSATLRYQNEPPDASVICHYTPNSTFFTLPVDCCLMFNASSWRTQRKTVSMDATKCYHQQLPIHGAQSFRHWVEDGGNNTAVRTGHSYRRWSNISIQVSGSCKCVCVEMRRRRRNDGDDLLSNCIWLFVPRAAPSKPPTDGATGFGSRTTTLVARLGVAQWRPADRLLLAHALLNLQSNPPSSLATGLSIRSI